jgi:hypothetical protein
MGRPIRLLWLTLTAGEPQKMDETIKRLVVSIQQKQLVVFCGAGISLAPPSSVPSAAGLTAQCVAEYNVRGLQALPLSATQTLEALTEHLFAEGLQSFFVRDLVSWRPFRRDSNSQHDAIADLLTTGAASFGVTTNFDALVELSAMNLGEDTFDAAVDADQASMPRKHSQFVKLHGCARDPDHTLWCRAQLISAPPVSPANQTIRARLETLKAWLTANLREKTVLFVGFWTDWSYLGSVLAESVRSAHIPLVVLVDPQSAADLEAKAPELWNWARSNTEFVHLPMKGEVFLPQLRRGFSENLLSRVLREAAGGFGAATAGAAMPSVDFDGLDLDDLYSLRRDVYGVPSTRIPRYAQPDGSMDAVGRAHLFLRHGGATLDGSRYVTRTGQRIRVVNGRTKLVNKVRSDFSDEVSSVAGVDEDFVVCAGGSDDAGTPGHIGRSSGTPTIVRPSSTAEWLTLEAAVARGLF